MRYDKAGNDGKALSLSMPKRLGDSNIAKTNQVKSSIENFCCEIRLSVRKKDFLYEIFFRVESDLSGNKRLFIVSLYIYKSTWSSQLTFLRATVAVVTPTFLIFTSSGHSLNLFMLQQ